MSGFRGPLALLLSAVALATLIACTPFGDDGDGDDDSAERPPTATIPVVMSTFTPTEVIPPGEQTATAEAQGEAAAATATYRAGLPTPTPAAEIDPEAVLYPPRARLETPDALVESYLSTYSWQFSDDVGSYASVDAPITVLDQGDPHPVENGAQLSIIYYGEEYRTPPQQLEVAVYDYESNSATPVNPQTGETGEGPAFAQRTEPLQNLRVDPVDPTFALEGFQPGHYIIWAQGHWGEHPVFDRQLFVTWVFDIEIAG